MACAAFWVPPSSRYITPNRFHKSTSFGVRWAAACNVLIIAEIIRRANVTYHKKFQSLFSVLHFIIHKAKSVIGPRYIGCLSDDFK